jgi:hypothetical protein
VADEQIGKVALGLQRAQQVDNLRLHTDMSSAEVGSSSTTKRRLEHHGAGNGDALALAAGEFVRIAEARRWIEADIAQRVDNLAVALGGR